MTATPPVPAIDVPRRPTCGADLADAPTAALVRVAELCGTAVPTPLGELTLTAPGLVVGSVPVTYLRRALRRLALTGTMTVHGRSQRVTASIDAGHSWSEANIILDGRPGRRLSPLLDEAIAEAVTAGPVAPVLTVAARALWVARQAAEIRQAYAFAAGDAHSDDRVALLPWEELLDLDLPWPSSAQFTDTLDEHWQAVISWFAAELDLAGGSTMASALAKNGWSGTALELRDVAAAVLA